MSHHPSFLASTLEAGKYCDLTLICQGQEFLVHRIVVCSQSPVLAAACDGSFLEATNRTIRVTEYDPATVACMIEFMYKGAYRIPELSTEGKDGSKSTMAEKVLPHVLVNLIADYYNIPGLLTQANTEICQILEAGTELSFEGFTEVIKTVAESGDDALQGMVIKAVAKNTRVLLGQPEFTQLQLDILNPFTLHIILDVYEEYKEKHKDIVSKYMHSAFRVKDLERELASYRGTREMKRQSARIKDLEDVIQQCLEFSQGVTVCDNCMHKLRTYLENKEPHALRRCSDCLGRQSEPCW